MEIITSLTLSGITGAGSSPDTLATKKKPTVVSRIFFMPFFITKAWKK
jgi:hypothetical protein